MVTGGWNLPVLAVSALFVVPKRALLFGVYIWTPSVLETPSSTPPEESLVSGHCSPFSVILVISWRLRKGLGPSMSD